MVFSNPTPEESVKTESPSRCKDCLERGSSEKRKSHSPKFKVERYYEKFKQTNSTPKLTLVRQAKEKELKLKKRREQESEIRLKFLRALMSKYEIRRKSD